MSFPIHQFWWAWSRSSSCLVGTGKDLKSSDDLFSKIAFTDIDLGTLQANYTTAHIDGIFEQLIASMRIVGAFLRRKVLLYNIGCAMFVASVLLFIVGL